MQDGDDKPITAVEGDVMQDEDDKPMAAVETVTVGGDTVGGDEDDMDDFGDGEGPPEGSPIVDRDLLLSRLESLIFASPEPIGVRRLAAILNVDGKTVRLLVGELKTHYENRGIILEEISKGFQFRSNPDNAPILRDIFNLKPLKISKAALEALSIIAYRQPITRAEAEQIRGVDCGGVLKYLFEKNLVRVIGRKEEPGRPIIYGTTKAFLELFGLKSLSDLPALHEFSELWEENRRLVDEEIPPGESAETEPHNQTTETKNTSGPSVGLEIGSEEDAPADVPAGSDDNEGESDND